MICHQCWRESLIANPSLEQGTGWLFQCLTISQSDFDLTQDSRQYSRVIVHDM